MQMRRVVVTGMGAVSPFGRGVECLMANLTAGQSAVTAVPELARITGLRSWVAARVPGIDPKQIPRKFRRSMSSMSVFATLASYDAIAQAGLTPEACTSGDLGVVIGSTIGPTQVIEEFFRDFFTDRSLERMRSTLFFQIMNHSCATNVAQALDITGRILAPAAACSTGCQAVGYGYELIAMGKQEFLLCGGADEFHPLSAATFDVMTAASTRYNDCPRRTPRPFDHDRDGVVCGEGSGILLLESLESARRRGARILAEVLGFATVTDPISIANPGAESMATCMQKALLDGGLAPGDIDYVNAHATATLQGDPAECEAILRVFGDGIPVSSLKGHLGHTMAASGALELIATVEMLNRGTLLPTLNLDAVDPSCAGVRHVRGVEAIPIQRAVKNSFALGGVNSSLIVGRYAYD
jgi:3-oxoacyl-[acyl-carrier-protein] synthase II